MQHVWLRKHCAVSAVNATRVTAQTLRGISSKCNTCDCTKACSCACRHVKGANSRSGSKLGALISVCCEVMANSYDSYRNHIFNGILLLTFAMFLFLSWTLFIKTAVWTFPLFVATNCIIYNNPSLLWTVGKWNARRKLVLKPLMQFCLPPQHFWGRKKQVLFSLCLWRVDTESPLSQCFNPHISYGYT